MIESPAEREPQSSPPVTAMTSAAARSGALLGAALLCAPGLGQETTADDLVRSLAPLSGWSVTFGASPTPEGPWDATRDDGVPPAAIRHGQVLEPGEWRFGYRYTNHSLDGLRDGRDDLSRSDVVAEGYTSIADEMIVQEHLFELAYGWDERCTWVASLPVLFKELDTDLVGGGSIEQEAEGIGDLQLGVVYDLDHDEGRRLRLHVMLGVPTGSFDEEDGGPGGGDVTLPYPMQLGTGTFDLHPGVTWMRKKDGWSWGVQGAGRVHLGENSDDWAVGDSFDFNAWISRTLVNDVVGSLRLQNRSWGDYHGDSDDLDPTVDPLQNPHRQGGMRTDLAAGVAWELGAGRDVNRLELEVGVPVDEWLDGPQLGTDLLLTFGWRISL